MIDEGDLSLVFLRATLTDKRIFSNGMNASQELVKVKEDCIEYLLNRGIKWEKSL